MNTDARFAFHAWGQERAGRLLVVPHHPASDGRELKCPTCGSTQDLVLCIDKSPDTETATVGTRSDVKVHGRCFNTASPHEVFPTNRRMCDLADYLHEGEECVPVENYGPPVRNPLAGNVGGFALVAFLVLFAVGIYYLFWGDRMWLGFGLLLLGGLCKGFGHVLVRKGG